MAYKADRDPSQGLHPPTPLCICLTLSSTALPKAGLAATHFIQRSVFGSLLWSPHLKVYCHSHSHSNILLYGHISLHHQSVSSMRTRTLFCSIMYPQWLEQSQTENRCSINVCCKAQWILSIFHGNFHFHLYLKESSLWN